MKTSIVLALVAFALGACSSGARLVRKDTLGGQMRLEGAYMPAMSEARMVMLEHCGGRFEYRELGDEVAFRCKPEDTTGAREPAELAGTTAPRF